MTPDAPFRCATEADTRALASRVARLARPGQLVSLVGPLGAGKTTFAKGYAEALGVAVAVTSPTFTLVHHYRCGPDAPVEALAHADLWRLESGAEVVDLALDEALDDGAVAVVEWGDRFEVAPGRDRIVVTFTVEADGARSLGVDLSAAGVPAGALTGTAS